VTTPLGSLLVPAHDEASVITRCLETVLRDFAPDELEVVVACNGCTDATASLARAVAPHARVLDLPEPSKPSALRAAERLVTALPRIYLDADVVLPSASARAVLERLRAGDVLAARPPIAYDTTSSSAAVRRYYRARTGTAAVMGSLWGAGVYGLSAAGRERFTEFPDVVAEDLFVDQLFGPDEIAVVDCAPVVVNVPRTSRDLVRILRRTYRGKSQMVAAGNAAQTAGGTMADLGAYARQDLRSAADAAVYAAFAVAGRWQGRPGATVVWERDESSRVG
jgi:glycosyltransferase involved in cell wall biosynthesis